MPILDAALAFSLTMLVVASAVTLFVTLLRNIANVRSKELKAMLVQFYEDECIPLLKHEIKRLTNVNLKAAHALQGFVDEFYAKPPPGAASTADAYSYMTEKIDEVETDKTLTHLSTEDLVEYLKRTPLGDKLLTELGDKADEVFDKLAKRYEAIGARFTESFRKRSRLWTTIVALVVALVFNIDSIHLLDSYLKDDAMRQGILAQMDAIVDQYNSTVATLPDVAASTNTAAGGDAAQAANAAAATVVTKAVLQQSIDDTRAQIDQLQTSGFPIGRTYFPQGCWGEDTEDCTARNNTGGWIWWIVGIALTTGLAGLGAPFWYDAIRGISTLAQQASRARKATQG